MFFNNKSGRISHCSMVIAGCLVQVREKLQRLDGYFLKLADAMEAWIDAWEQLNPPVAPAVLSAPGALPAQQALPNGQGQVNQTARRAVMS